MFRNIHRKERIVRTQHEMDFMKKVRESFLKPLEEEIEAFVQIGFTTARNKQHIPLDQICKNLQSQAAVSIQSLLKELDQKKFKHICSLRAAKIWKLYWDACVINTEKDTQQIGFANFLDLLEETLTNEPKG